MTLFQYDQHNLIFAFFLNKFALVDQWDPYIYIYIYKNSIHTVIHSQLDPKSREHCRANENHSNSSTNNVRSTASSNYKNPFLLHLR